MSKNKSLMFGMGLLAGVVGGLIAGVLYAPKSGEESRRQIKDAACELYEKNSPAIKEAKKQALENIDLMKYKLERQLRKFNNMVKSKKMQKAKAFVFAADEDFGMIPIEAQSCGTPVIAYGRGGSLETVKDGVTGIFFYEQTVDSIIDAVERFEKLETPFDPKMIRNHAETFSEERFKKEIKEFVELKYNEFNHLVK